jgi:zinc protease
MIAVNISIPQAPPTTRATSRARQCHGLVVGRGRGRSRFGRLQAGARIQGDQALATAERDYVVVTLTTLKENADEAFRLATLALTHPRFDAEAVERIRAMLLASLKQEDEDPSRAAVKAWYAAYFGTHLTAIPRKARPPESPRSRATTSSVSRPIIWCAAASRWRLPATSRKCS